MSPETRAFLDAVRTAEDPTTEDERRVLTAVQAAVATGATVSAGLAVSNGVKLFRGGSISTSLKLGGLVVGLGGAAWVASTTLSTNVPGPPAKPTPPQHFASAHVPNATSRTSPPRGPGKAPEMASAAVPLPSAKPAAPPSSATGPRATPPAPPSLRDEIALLAEVKVALDRGDGATALRLLDERASVDQRLLAERKAARILALCMLGRTREAERSARAFSREHPSSVQKTAIERSCAGKATGPR
jgi:hypothetical protein